MKHNRPIHSPAPFSLIQFSPEPLDIQTGDFTYYINRIEVKDANDRVIADLDMVTDYPGKKINSINNIPEWQANARLFRCAPEMLEMIQKIARELKHGNYQGNHVQAMVFDLEQLAKKVKDLPIEIALDPNPARP